MIPTRKISETILDFGKALIMDLPENYSKEEFEAVIKVIVMVWNAVVLDSWNKGNDYEVQLLEFIDSAPQEIKLSIKGLIKRKKGKFAYDVRGVGDYWVRKSDGEFIFRCEARLDLDKIDIDGMAH